MGAYDNITYGTIVSNGQILPVLERSAFASGNAVGPIYAGGAASPSTVPPNASTGSGAAYAASSSPFNVKTSGVVFLLVMIVASVLWLRYIHWG